MSDLSQALLDAMTFRCIGPPRGGRVVAVAGDPTRPAVYYFGAVAGGIWKTEDAGTTWRNLSDGFLKTASVGALTVSPSDPNVLYAGMGESTIRTDVSHGDGVYKSTDGGVTWTHCGLADTRHIGEIRVHPKNPDIVYVAALGHAFGPNPDRGLYRSTDGGKSWQLVLHKSDRAGAVDITLDPRNPDILYATVWETHRNFWELSSGGPDSGLWKSTDGGDTWTDISRNQGLPQAGIYGKIGVSASPVQAGRVWALVEASEKPGLYRSDDFGRTWEFLTDDQNLRYRPWYYMHVFADTRNPDTVYVNNLSMWKSTDGGKNFTEIATPHGDNHDLWIDPRDNQRMIQSNDGGANISFNGGASWSTVYNQFTAQFYHVATDNQFPYRVYGTQQDNSSISVPSDTTCGAIAWSDCYAAGTGESGYIAVHPDDPNIVYVGAVGSSPGGAGALQRYDHRSGQIRLINVWPQAYGGMGAGDLKYRFPWTYPVLFSPHDSTILYTCGNHVFRSRDEGTSWEPISPDLTRADTSKLGPSGGPITKDTSGAEFYATIYTFRESPHAAGVFWAGSDDGLVHLSRDGGKTWTDVTPPDLPEWSFVRTVEPSPHDPASLYLAATRYKLDDPAPYLYKTEDYGQNWHKLTDGLPADDFVRVVRADPVQPGLLYAGTETGLYVSLDDGATWQRWAANFPVTPVYDLTVKDADLVVATHGRAFWIMDDLTPLRQLAAAQDDGNRLFATRPAVRIVPDLFAAWTTSEGKGYAIGLTTAATFVAKKTATGHIRREFLDAGEGAPHGALITYVLGEAPDADTPVALTIRDADGAVVRSFTPKPAGYDEWDDKRKAMEPGPWIATGAGVHRFLWDLRGEGSARVPGDKTAGAAYTGALVLPGAYTVELTVGDATLSTDLTVINDPRSPASMDELRAQHELLTALYAKVTGVHQAVIRLRDVREQLAGWKQRLAGHDDVIAQIDTLTAKLDEVEDPLILPGEQKDTFGLNEKTRLNAALGSMIALVGSADARPTKQAGELTADYFGQIDDHLETLDQALSGDLATVNAAIRAADAPPVV